MWIVHNQRATLRLVTMQLKRIIQCSSNSMKLVSLSIHLPKSHYSWTSHKWRPKISSLSGCSWEVVTYDYKRYCDFLIIILISLQARRSIRQCDILFSSSLKNVLNFPTLHSQRFSGWLLLSQVVANKQRLDIIYAISIHSTWYWSGCLLEVKIDRKYGIISFKSDRSHLQGVSTINSNLLKYFWYFGEVVSYKRHLVTETFECNLLWKYSVNSDKEILSLKMCLLFIVV